MTGKAGYIYIAEAEAVARAREGVDDPARTPVLQAILDGELHVYHGGYVLEGDSAEIAEQVRRGEVTGFQVRRDEVDRRWPPGRRVPAGAPGEGAWVPPFIALMFRAIDEFGLTETSTVGKKTLAEWFAAQTLPDGTRVSTNLAGYLATFCRPPEAMKGGNPKWG
ncbi:MAG: hypothetical protein RBU25_19540 [Lentisphaeria bacterium]|nr:hypothetical protein [Lentisphaeria bacterium]